MKKEEIRSIAAGWAFVAVCILLIVTVLILLENRDSHVAIDQISVEKANSDIEGYYDMYSKALTQYSRDLTITRIKKDFKWIDANTITSEKYRNFLINTRNN